MDNPLASFLVGFLPFSSPLSVLPTEAKKGAVCGSSWWKSLPSSASGKSHFSVSKTFKKPWPVQTSPSVKSRGNTDVRSLCSCVGDGVRFGSGPPHPSPAGGRGYGWQEFLRRLLQQWPGCSGAALSAKPGAISPPQEPSQREGLGCTVCLQLCHLDNQLVSSLGLSQRERVALMFGKWKGVQLCCLNVICYCFWGVGNVCCQLFL